MVNLLPRAVSFSTGYELLPDGTETVTYDLYKLYILNLILELYAENIDGYVMYSMKVIQQLKVKNDHSVEITNKEKHFTFILMRQKEKNIYTSLSR